MVREITIAILLAVVGCGHKASSGDGGTDAAPGACFASGGCAQGPQCGSTCCGFGEKCVDGACHCATGAACGPGDRCESFGPIMPDGCGSFCCGVTQPCPQ